MPDVLTRTRWNADGSQIITTGLEGTIQFWDSLTGDVLHVSDARASIWSAEYSPDGLLIASTASNGTIRLWDAYSGAEQAFIFPPASGSESDTEYVYGPSISTLTADLEQTLEAFQFEVDTLDVIRGNTGTLSGTKTVSLTYFGRIGEDLSFEVESQANVTIRVLDINGVIIGEGDTHTLTVTLPADGIYTIELSNPTGGQEFTDYDLTTTSSLNLATPEP